MKKLFLILALCISVSAFAQIEQGDKNVTFSATYIGIEGFSFGIINAKLGYYVTQNIEVGAKPNIIITEESTDFGLGAYGTYNWLTQDAKLLPYAGAEISFLPVGEETITTLGIYGGSKYFITERVNVDAGLNLQKSLSSDTFDGTVFIFQVGIGFIFGN